MIWPLLLRQNVGGAGWLRDYARAVPLDEENFLRIAATAVSKVGFQAHDAKGEEHPEMVLDGLVSVVRATGHIGQT